MSAHQRTTDQYDVIGALYERTKALPVGQAERGTLLAALPDLLDASVLDVGTGTGFYPRIYKALGAARVVGVDSSAEMITYARRVEEREPLGIAYRVLDGGALPVLGAFDVVTAIWLLGYAEGVPALDRMLAGLAANLAPGGTFVALTPNPDLEWAGLPQLRRYGLDASRADDSHGRQGYAVHMAGDPPFDFVGFLWPPGVIEPALTRAGLVDIRRHPVTVPVSSLVEHGAPFWTELERNPSFAVFTARRPASR